MSLSTATPSRIRETSDYLFELASHAQQEFHKAKERGDKDEMALMGVLKSSCLFVAARLSPDRFEVAKARDILHAELLTILHRTMHQDLHAPRNHWTQLSEMFEQRRKGGLR